MARGKAIAAVGLVVLLAVACGQRAASPGTNASPTATGPIASNLPKGVCAPAYEQLRNPNAIRIEAKLVTFDTLSTTDPTFPPGWKTPPRSAYFWVVAELGTFTVQPHSIAGYSSPETFSLSLGYIQAISDPTDPETLVHPCRSIGGSLNNASWPAWFDGMAALADVKIR